MKVYFSVPGREVVECDLPMAPPVGHSIAFDGDGVLHEVIGVVWDLAPPGDGKSGGEHFEIWVFCDPEGKTAATWSPTIVPFPNQSRN